MPASRKALIAELRANKPSDAAIEKRALANEWTSEDAASTRMVHPENKVAVALRLDADVVAAYKASGRGWQTRINDTLRAKFIAEPLRFDHRQIDALEQFARAIGRSEWAAVGFDGEAKRANMLAEKVQSALAGSQPTFTSDELQWVSELAASYFELSEPLLNDPMASASARKNAGWQHALATELSDLASLIRPYVKGRKVAR